MKSSVRATTSRRLISMCAPSSHSPYDACISDGSTLWRPDEAINNLGARLIADDGPARWTTGLGQDAFPRHGNPFVVDHRFVAGRTYSRFGAPTVSEIATAGTIGRLEAPIPCRERAIVILWRGGHSGRDRCHLSYRDRRHRQNAESCAASAWRWKGAGETQVGH